MAVLVVGPWPASAPERAGAGAALGRPSTAQRAESGAAVLAGLSAVAAVVFGAAGAAAARGDQERAAGREQEGAAATGHAGNRGCDPGAAAAIGRAVLAVPAGGADDQLEHFSFDECEGRGHERAAAARREPLAPASAGARDGERRRAHTGRHLPFLQGARGVEGLGAFTAAARGRRARRDLDQSRSHQCTAGDRGPEHAPARKACATAGSATPEFGRVGCRDAERGREEAEHGLGTFRRVTVGFAHRSAASGRDLRAGPRPPDPAIGGG